MGVWVTKKMPDALGADQPDGGGDGVQEGLRGVVEQQVGLVQEEHELGFVQVAGFGQFLEEVGQQPHQERGEQHRLGLQRGQLQAGDDAAAVRGGAQQFGGIELGFAEELLHALRLERDQFTEDDAGGGLGQAAEFLELVLALVRGEELDDGAQVLQVDQFEVVLVREVEDQLQAGFLGVVELHDAGEQDGAEGGDGGADRDAVAVAAQGQELHRERLAGPGLADALGAGHEFLAAGGGGGQPGEVALDVRQEHGHPGGGQLLGHHVQGDGLAGAGGAGHQAVPVHHGQRQPDGGVLVEFAVDDGGTQFDGGALQGVALLDGGDFICSGFDGHAVSLAGSGRGPGPASSRACHRREQK